MSVHILVFIVVFIHKKELTKFLAFISGYVAYYSSYLILPFEIKNAFMDNIKVKPIYNNSNTILLYNFDLKSATVFLLIQ